jgi:hypothetical protein
MATSTPDGKQPVKNKSMPKDKDASLIPPDEKFWQRYSPNHEFPISSVSSALIHLFVLGVLILGARSLANWDSPVDVDALVIGGGGGRPEGQDGPATGKFAKREDVKDVVDSDVPRSTPLVRGEQLKDVDKIPAKTVQAPDTKRLINEDLETGNKKLSALGEKVRDRLNAMQLGVASKGKGGSGEGGGLGKGKGPGEGDSFGPGKGTINRRQERQKRWTMIFNIRDPEDYARQLQAMGAVLAVPGRTEGEYLVIENLTQRPVVAKPKTVSDINRMFWIDDKPDAVEPLFRVLGYEPIPSYFVAFFPEELERELLKKELAYQSLSEDKIEDTRFQIRRSTFGSYEPVVIKQTKR